MDTAVKISVITVCYNAESVIEKTIRSVLNQTYEDLEYIIVDGASKDHTPDIIEGYLADTRVKYLSEPDKGIYDAMNKGAGMATGDYLEFLNAGDVLVDDQVISHIAERAGRSGADILYGDILYINPDGTTEKRVYGQFCSSLFYYLLGDCINHQAAFAKRDCFKQGFDLTYRICADREWMLRQKKQGKTFLATGILICEYSLDENSASIRDKKRYYDEADRCVKEHLKSGYLLFWGLNIIRNGKVSSKVLHKLYEVVFLRQGKE